MVAVRSPHLAARGICQAAQLRPARTRKAPTVRSCSTSRSPAPSRRKRPWSCTSHRTHRPRIPRRCRHRRPRHSHSDRAEHQLGPERRRLDRPGPHRSGPGVHRRCRPRHNRLRRLWRRRQQRRRHRCSPPRRLPCGQAPTPRPAAAPAWSSPQRAPQPVRPSGTTGPAGERPAASATPFPSPPGRPAPAFHRGRQPAPPVVTCPTSPLMPPRHRLPGTHRPAGHPRRYQCGRPPLGRLGLPAHPRARTAPRTARTRPVRRRLSRHTRPWPARHHRRQ